VSKRAVALASAAASQAPTKAGISSQRSLFSDESSDGAAASPSKRARPEDGNARSSEPALLTIPSPVRVGSGVDVSQEGIEKLAPKESVLVEVHFQAHTISILKTESAAETAATAVETGTTAETRVVIRECHKRLAGTREGLLLGLEWTTLDLKRRLVSRYPEAFRDTSSIELFVSTAEGETCQGEGGEWDFFTDSQAVVGLGDSTILVGLRTCEFGRA